MKSLLKLGLIFLFVVCGFTACIAPQGPQGPPGPPGADGYVNRYTHYYNITRWNLAANGQYFFAEVSEPAITYEVFIHGVIVGYLVQNYDYSNETHIPLPYEMFYNNYDNYGNIIQQWTETVSYEVVPGRITFYFEPSDFYTGYTPPAMWFKIAAMW